jgi:hypothetical protein
MPDAAPETVKTFPLTIIDGCDEEVDVKELTSV